MEKSQRSDILTCCVLYVENLGAFERFVGGAWGFLVRGRLIEGLNGEHNDRREDQDRRVGFFYRPTEIQPFEIPFE